MDQNSLLLLNNKIYVPFAGNLHTHVLQYNHDHILARHFGQNKTLELVHCGYSWPSLHADVQQFCKSCVKIKKGGLDLFYFSFLFLFSFQFIFLFLEQLGLGLIGHAVTSVTT